ANDTSTVHALFPPPASAGAPRLHRATIRAGPRWSVHGWGVVVGTRPKDRPLVSQRDSQNGNSDHSGAVCPSVAPEVNPRTPESPEVESNVTRRSGLAKLFVRRIRPDPAL